MPYINKEARNKLSAIKLEYFIHLVDSPGELNYLITRLIMAYIKDHGKSYTTMNEVIGVLECCKSELYRRVISSYESEKCAENGDVY